MARVENNQDFQTALDSKQSLLLLQKSHKQFLKELWENPTEGEYKCPADNTQVTTEHCEAACMGEGCMYTETCNPYKTAKEILKEE